MFLGRCVRCGAAGLRRSPAGPASSLESVARAVAGSLQARHVTTRPPRLRAHAGGADQHPAQQEESSSGATPAPGEAALIAGRFALHQTVTVSALDVPTRVTKDALRALHSLLATLPGTQVVVRPTDESAGTRRHVLLCPLKVPPGTHHDQWPPVLQDFTRGLALEAGEAAPRVVAREQVQTYASMSAAAALHLLLPTDVPAPSSFEEVGHIIHLNLRETQRPWARLIGAVLLDKCPRARTVVNKLGTLSGAHRTFALELLAGEGEYVTQVVESGATFRVDLSSVYWNSRLGPERQRLVALWGPGDTVLDLCAGVGPIAVAAARAGALVLANDVNPSATACLLANAAANGVAHAVSVTTGDGAQLARTLLAGDRPPQVTQVVCNLPELAPELVGAALSRAFVRHTWGDAPLPVCHVYAFSKAARAEEEVLGRIAAALGVSPDLLLRGSPGGDGPGTGPHGALAWTHVRDVAPGKAMLRATFRLPQEAGFGP